jgi:adenylate cyclase class 2
VYEVEVKFPVADAESLERKLVALAARFREPVEQVDLYFAHPARDFARTDEALRLRNVGQGVALTWKGPRIDAATKTRREIELPLADLPAMLPGGPPTTLERWSELLEALGFRRVREVAKRRRPARVLWQGAEVDVALDHVASLGDFIELELQAREGEVPLAQACVTSLAHELGCGEPERRSYLELLLMQQPITR